MKLQGQNVWLIGASSGIGAALAPKLAAKGATLAISARREDELEKIAASCAPHEVLVKSLDVTDNDAVVAVYRELVASWGRVDSVIFSAGSWTAAQVTEFDSARAIEQINVNYLGLVRVVGTVMPDMIARRSGSIVGMASIAGYGGFPRAAAYSSSKAGVLAFLQSIRIELKKFNVEVQTISPGFVETPLTDKNDFVMPFKLDADVAADRIIEGLLAGDEEIHFPRRLSIPVKLLTALPRPAYEWIAGKLMAR
ncbi:MAG: SDR family NAD(P)-dependent oxidoreductase [Dehalococcoidia bacterium]